METLISKQLLLPVAPKEQFTFDNFVVGQNAQLVNHLIAVARMQRETQIITYLFGGEGVGKTHLLYAMCENSEHIGVSAIYLDLNDLIKYSTDVLNGLESMQLICMDNIDAIQQKAEWQTALFDLINRVLEIGTGKIVFAARNSAKNLCIELPDLVSRLTWGISYSIDSITDEDLVKAIALKAKERGIKMSLDVSNYLYKHQRRSIKELIKVLDILDEESLQGQRPITIPFIKKVLPDNR